MIFKSTTIPPKGRNKYGQYLSAGNITNKVVSYTNNNTILKPVDTTTPTIPNTSSYGLTLSKTQGNFQWDDVAPNDTYTDTINVYGFKDMNRVPVFVGNLENEITTKHYDINGLPESGVTAVVVNNGTTATTVNVNVSSDVDIKGGTLYIPCNIYTGNVSSPDDEYKSSWIEEKDNIKTIWLEYNYTIIINGGKGEKGTKGATIRGPIDYKSITKERRFCNGVKTTDSHPEDEYYIDIVVFDGIYYQCKTSYNWDERDVDHWDVGVQETYWTRVDEQYEFVAANLLLAENGKINFASSNELYLLDDRDNVTAGAAGGTGVNFWAGASAPTNAPFTVDNNGKMIAKKGTFGNLSITTDEFGDAELYGEHIQADETTKNTISIQPHLIKMDARDKDISEKQSSYSTITIAPYFDSDIYDYNAPLQVDTYGRGGNAIWTDGDVTASNIDVYGEYTRTYTNPEDDAVYTMNEWASMSPIPNLRIVPLCATNALFTRYNNIWHFNNVSLGISSLLYPTIVQHPADYSWGFKSSSGTSSKWTGIASAQTPKQNNVIYIKLN